MTNVAVVTGCSSGIGYETALQLAKEGYKTYATMRDLNKRFTLEQSAQKENLDLKVLQIDVNLQNTIDSAIEFIVSESGQIDVLVNNAGYGMMGSIEDLSIDEIKQQFETDFFGPIRMIKAVVPIMRKQNSGRIINVSSIAGQIGFAISSAYVSSKFALEGLTDSLRQELQPFGIHLSLIEPGVVKTNFHKNMRVASKSHESSYKEMTEQIVTQAKTLFEKGIEPEYVAKNIIDILKETNPLPRYPIGEDAELLLEEKSRRNGIEFEKYIQEVFKDVLSFSE